MDIELMRTAIVLNHYASGADRASIAHDIPMRYRDEVLAYYRAKGQPIHLFYRGTRSHPNDTRSRRNRHQNCIRAFANRFAVYPRFDYKWKE
jgi:hypothetical protein